MNVPSFSFLAAAAVVALVINLSNKPKWRTAVFAVANIAFVLTFTHDVAQLAPFAGLIVAGFLGLKLSEAWKRKGVALALIVLFVALFCWLKEYSFIPAATYLPYIYFTVGMSYVFFRVLHLIIDAGAGMLPVRLGPIEYVAYTLNFTSLVSGPIQLYQDYRKTAIESPASLDGAAIGRAVERIVQGLFKVSIMSPLLQAAYQSAESSTALGPDIEHRIAYGALTVAIFPLFLYINFSGYMDFVIGVARFMRLELPENFNQPFSAVSFLDFWSRWHITLSGWLKRYVYTTLAIALLRRFPEPKFEPYIGVFAYFVTFFLIGVWHGQTTMFLFYGLLQGAGVSVNKLYSILMVRLLGRKPYKALCASPLYEAISRGLTFTYFAVTLIWFWASAAQLMQLYRAVGTLGAACAITSLILSASIALAVIYRMEHWFEHSLGSNLAVFRSIYVRTAWTTALLVLTVSVVLVLDAPAPHIVYRGF